MSIERKATTYNDRSYHTFSDFKSKSADMVNISPEQLSQITELAKVVTDMIRQDVKKQNYIVEALNRKSNVSKNNIDQNNNFNNLNPRGENDSIGKEGSSLNIESHPELPYSGGKPNDQIYFPENIIESGLIPEAFLTEAQKEELQKSKKKKKEILDNLLKLANRMANKFKFKFTGPKNAPKIQPKQVPRSRPAPKPNPYNS